VSLYRCDCSIGVLWLNVQTELLFGLELLHLCTLLCDYVTATLCMDWGLNPPAQRSFYSEPSYLDSSGHGHQINPGVITNAVLYSYVYPCVILYTVSQLMSKLKSA